MALVDPRLAPGRIWLLLHEGDQGAHVWCDQPNPTGTGEHDAVEYVRADLMEEAKRLLGKALADSLRVERVNEGSGNSLPLYLSTTRWEFVRQARRLLDED
jgi:hypothetical protein